MGTVKPSYRVKYDEKLDQLRFKYREDEQEKLDKIPSEMQEFITLSIFDREKFERVETLTYEVTCVGEVKLSDEEYTQNASKILSHRDTPRRVTGV